MHYGWRRHSDIPRRRYWTALIVPLFAVAVILLGIVWELTRADSDVADADQAPAAAQPTVELASGPGFGDEGDSADTAGAQLYASRHEAANLQEELSDATLQLQQGSAALVTSNEKVQTLEGELASATEKIAEAKADREEALRVAGKMWEDWRRLRKDLSAVCATLDAEKNSPDAASACQDAKKE
jgi:hypothetical protein